MLAPNQPCRGTAPTRFWVMLMLLFPLSAAMAVEQPGPPPWSCSVWGACNAADTCVSLSTLPMKFKLTQIGDDARKFHLQGPDGYEGVACNFPAWTTRNILPKPIARMSPLHSSWSPTAGCPTRIVFGSRACGSAATVSASWLTRRCLLRAIAFEETRPDAIWAAGTGL